MSTKKARRETRRDGKGQLIVASAAAHALVERRVREGETTKCEREEALKAVFRSPETRMDSRRAG